MEAAPERHRSRPSRHYGYDVLMSPSAVLTLRRGTDGDIRTSPPPLFSFPLSRMDGITPPSLPPPPSFVPLYGDDIRYGYALPTIRYARASCPCFGGVLAADAKLSASEVQTSIASVTWRRGASRVRLSERGCAFHGFANIPRASMPYLLGGLFVGDSNVFRVGNAYS